MKKFTFALAFLFSFSFIFSQTVADNWYFGNMAAMKFNGATPTVVLNSSMFASEGCSSISDASGNLLFYTNGQTVWNKNHVVMTNGSGLLGGASATQAALIVPKPGSTSLYYIFHVDDQGGINSLRYTMVDITLGAGLGGVTATKNVTLQTVPMDEKLCAVMDPNNNRYWIAAHEFGSNKFFAYELNPSGLQPPIISLIGAVHSNTLMQNCYGQMKFNGCGTKLGLALGYMKYMELFDFNTNTGAVSNPMTFPMPDNVYGLEFSSDSKMLYVSTYDATLTLEQFDISSNTFSTIAVTQTNVPAASGLSIYALQLAPNKKIYVNKSNSNWVGVINTPSASGAACNYVDQALDLDPNTVGKDAAQSLPGFVSSYFNTATCPSGTTSAIAENTLNNKISVYPNPSNGEFKIKLETNSTITIYSYNGSVIEELKGNENISFGKNYAAGIYFVRISNENESGTLKIVKE